jgi:hypothetical protein
MIALSGVAFWIHNLSSIPKTIYTSDDISLSLNGLPFYLNTLNLNLAPFLFRNLLPFTRDKDGQSVSSFDIDQLASVLHPRNPDLLCGPIG